MHLHRRTRDGSRTAIILMIACAGILLACGSDEPRLADLPDRSDQWVTELSFNPDTHISYVGKTVDLQVTQATTVRELQKRTTLRVGDNVEGIVVGAIRCSFHTKDAVNGGQYMWRGRWGCQAGRSKDEVENAIGPEGEKRFEYLLIAPVSLPNS